MDATGPGEPSEFRAALWAVVGALALCLVAVIATPARAGGADAAHVVNIYAELGQSGPAAAMGQGTGFFVGADGTIATAYHVVRGARNLIVWDGRSNRFEGSQVLVVAVDPERDLALLRVESRLVHPYLRLDFNTPTRSDALSVIGNFRGVQAHRMETHATEPAGLARVDWRPTGGAAARVEIIPLDLPVLEGMSGAPVLSGDGRVIGLLSGRSAGKDGVAWAIPARYIEALMTSEEDPRPVDRIDRWPGTRGAGWDDLRRRYVSNAEAVDAVERFHERLEALEIATESLSRSAGPAAGTVMELCVAVRKQVDDLALNYGRADAERLNARLARGPAPVRLTEAVLEARGALSQRLDLEGELRALIEVFDGWMASTDLEGEHRLAMLEFHDEMAVRYRGIGEHSYESAIGLDAEALERYLDRLSEGLPRFASIEEAEAFVTTCRAAAKDLARYGWMHELEHRVAEHELFNAYAGLMNRFEQYFVGMPAN